MTSTSGGAITTLKKLRLLPPPANELVPVLSAVAFFTILSVTLREEFALRWKSFLDDTLKVVDAETLFVYGHLAIYMTMYWGYSLLFHVVELVLPDSMLRPFKIQPTASMSIKEIVSMLPLVLFNQIFMGIPMLKLFHALLKWRITLTYDGEDSSDAMEQLVYAIPSVGRFVISMVVNVLSVEFYFYPVHRCLHHPKLYRLIHKIHHTYKAPTVVESAYVHPVEFCLNSLPVLFIGNILTGAPLILQWIWIWTVTFLQVHDHSGYWIPFLPRVLMHDYHHQQFNCCYGIIGLLDGILGTDGGFPDFVKENEEACARSEKEKE